MRILVYGAGVLGLIYERVFFLEGKEFKLL